MFFPNGLHAGFLSLFSDFINRVTFVNEREANSQNIALLQGVLNPTFNPASGGGDLVIVDDSALLPETGPSGDEYGKVRPSSDQISLYVVHEGDSLSQIAKMFNVSVNTIVWGNNLRGSTIKPGQTLVILPVSGIRHTVKSGDTLAKIAKTYKGDLDEIVQYNNISANASLAVGSVVIIPDGEAPQTATITSSSVKGTTYPHYEGYYMRPVQGVRSQGLHGYNGIDIAAPSGTPVFASASGVVIISRDSGWNGGYGDYVVIAHDNGTQTLYAHMSRVLARVGQVVSQGEVIGYVGSTGRSTGSHLHFEVRGARNPF
ncbi:MAG: peptidoglycan DD-metalloendopeptidase family protein [Patescibacteria group bacterium]|nr:peptidoglycan DD-metalloendopeptidase family protein [bacterium]MDZ4241066.1 peptidoglycan DD-metalloendopeptidase family protein [Patescibacteria group bacterium]